MNKLKILICILFVANLHTSVQAQIQYTSSNKKAIKYFDLAMSNFQSKQYEDCENNLLKALKEDDQFAEAHLMLAQIFDEQKKYDKANLYYKNVLEIDADFFPNIYLSLAYNEFILAAYDEALGFVKKFLTYDKIPEKTRKNALFLQKNCEFASEAVKNPRPFTPVNLGDSVNSLYNDYSPSLTVDEQTLVITVALPRNAQTIHQLEFEEDFYVSYKTSGGRWEQAERMGAPLNSHGNEGAQSLSPDGKVLYFTICNRSDGLGSCDIYRSERTGNRWSMPVNLGIKVNSGSWDSQPSISSDGKTLYFASARSGGYGKMDIWKTTRDDEGGWSSPINLGDSINTEHSEMSPFIHPDGKTLYFTSSGHPGMGGMDIFYSVMDNNGNWSKPKNMGYPINTNNDEGFLIVNAQGNKAYFSSDKLGGVGGLDIYTFDLYEEARPTAVTYLKGTVYDSKTKKRLQATFELISLESSEVAVRSESDNLTGEFLVSLPTDKSYALNVSRDGYLFYSENFTLQGDHSKIKPFVKDVFLQPIEAGTIVVLKNIFFDFDKFDLKPESQAELNRLQSLLTKNPGMKIEIGGHTDNKGSAEYNQKLSESRARAVYDYLVNKGIDKNRLSFKGYGLTKPVDTNDSEEGRANNRRTEFKVISN